MKYEILKENKQGTLFQIRALKDFSDVKKGDLGGFIECEDNLSHEGDCWVYDNALVWNGAKVKGNAQVRDNSQVFDHATITGTAILTEDAEAYDGFYMDEDELWDDCTTLIEGNGCTYNGHCNEDGYCPACGSRQNEDGYCNKGQ